MVKSEMKIGEWAFIGGVLIAALAALLGEMVPLGIVALVLLILGLIVGFLNVNDKEAVSFLVAGIALSVAGQANFLIINSYIPTVGTYIVNILGNIALFVAPAVVIVALKAVMNIARD